MKGGWPHEPVLKSDGHSESFSLSYGLCPCLLIPYFTIWLSRQDVWPVNLSRLRVVTVQGPPGIYTHRASRTGAQFLLPASPPHAPQSQPHVITAAENPSLKGWLYVPQLKPGHEGDAGVRVE